MNRLQILILFLEISLFLWGVIIYGIWLII